jgi:hypothetical protein
MRTVRFFTAGPAARQPPKRFLHKIFPVVALIARKRPRKFPTKTCPSPIAGGNSMYQPVSTIHRGLNGGRWR